MLSHNDLKKGVKFKMEEEPYEVMDSSFSFKGRGSSVVQAKIKNLITGNLIPKAFHAGEKLEEVEIEKIQIKFLYTHKDKYTFCYEEDPSKRFELTKEQLGNQAQFLKANQLLDGIYYEDKMINISLPIKINYKVTEAPPGLKGDRAQSGTKVITIESGATMNAPLFVEEGDVIEINTETGEYVRRVE